MLRKSELCLKNGKNSGLINPRRNDNSGDIMGDINKRRGRVLGMDPNGKLMVISAEVPESELSDFPTVLRSVTRGVGSFYTEFARYEEVPASIAQKIIAESKAE